MCRLFGLHAGATPVDAAFWLLDAADNLERQSHRNSDGFGIGTFRPDGTPVVDKAPRPAFQDTDFATAAHRLRGRTFVAHVRNASTGGLLMRNTHPFLQDGRLFAHNGAFADLPLLDRRLAELDGLALVGGDTDSERMFALITLETRRQHGDLTAGITTAVRWLIEHVPIVSLNFVLTTPTDVWAFRYPETDELHVLARAGRGSPAAGRLHLRGTRLAAAADDLETRPSVVVASERLDGDTGWRLLDAGELLHVHDDLHITTTTPIR